MSEMYSNRYLAFKRKVGLRFSSLSCPNVAFTLGAERDVKCEALCAYYFTDLLPDGRALMSVFFSPHATMRRAHCTSAGVHAA